mgnify:CR=1 FL=1
MSLDSMWIKSHITTNILSVVVPLVSALVIPANPNRWGFVFPAVNGTSNPVFFPRQVPGNASYLYFTTPQFAGTKTHWTYEDLGPMIEEAWFAGIVGGPIALDVVEMVLPVDIKTIIENYRPTNIGLVRI